MFLPVTILAYTITNLRNIIFAYKINRSKFPNKSYGVKSSTRNGDPSVMVVYIRVATMKHPSTANKVLYRAKDVDAPIVGSVS